MIEEFPNPEIVGQFRTFGPWGPTYKILAPLKNDTEWMVHILIPETYNSETDTFGEYLDYKLSRALEDPLEEDADELRKIFLHTE